MPMHPAAPRGLPDLVAALADTLQGVIDLGHSCSQEDLARPTECPGWTVHDQISHVVGVEAWLAGHKDPRVQMPHYEHIRNDLGKRVEYAVEARRGRTGAEVVAELEIVLAQRLSTLRSPELIGTSIIPGPFGPDQATNVLLLRTFDVWVHEQDIRAAIGCPGNLDSPAATVVVNSVLTQLPKLIAKGAALEPGHSVVIDVTGPVMARQGVRVEVDEQGRTRGHAMFSGGAQVTDDGSRAFDQPHPAPVIISLSTEDFTRRAAGRRSVSETAYRVVGDEAIARRVLEALVVTR